MKRQTPNDSDRRKSTGREPQQVSNGGHKREAKTIHEERHRKRLGPNLQRNTFFNRMSKLCSRAMGNSLSFAVAFAVILAWGLTGPLFGFSDTWQLVINTGTTIITFLMVFLIQNTQNRDSQAMHLKLDELIRSTKGHNILLDLEELPQEILDRIKTNYCELAAVAREEIEHGQADTGNPEVELK